MEYRDELWNDLHVLLVHLQDFGAVNLVDHYYERFDNPAPAILLKGDIQKLKEHLQKGKTQTNQ